MTHLEFFNEDIMIPITSQIGKKLFPEFIHIKTSNGRFKLKLGDYVINPPKLYTVYHHSTLEDKGDALDDGEPDFLCIDFNFMKKDKDFEVNMEITYGDAMMFEFKVKKWNNVDVFHYNGENSKFDPKYSFTFEEKSIQDLLKIFNRFGFRLTRDRLNFLDDIQKSYDTTKNGGQAPNF
jgi:hypothetical protein